MNFYETTLQSIEFDMLRHHERIDNAIEDYGYPNAMTIAFDFRILRILMINYESFLNTTK